MEPSTELAIRMASFAAIFAVMAAWELLRPCRTLLAGRKPRWPSNLAILVIDSLAVRLLIPTAVVGVAVMASEHGWGLFNWMVMPGWIAGLAGFLILDFVIYAQHYAFHHVPWLWRLHRMHHADLDLDLTTGVRFHPLEILLSLAIKIAAVLAFGIPAIAVLVFEAALNATSVFNHANVAMPAWLDRVMRFIVVTPDMHRVHHSIERTETDSNFGFNLPWWDRLFGTYRAQPAAGHQRMTIGLPVFRNLSELRIDRLLTQPFRDEGAVDARLDVGMPRAAIEQNLSMKERSKCSRRCASGANSQERIMGNQQQQNNPNQKPGQQTQHPGQGGQQQGGQKPGQQGGQQGSENR